MSKRIFRALLGKKIIIHFDGKRRGLCGQHMVRIVGVYADRKKELATIRIRRFRPSTGKYDGRAVILQPAEWSAGCCGVVFRKKIVPVTQFLLG